jgi:hypothetical protein
MFTIPLTLPLGKTSILVTQRLINWVVDGGNRQALAEKLASFNVDAKKGAIVMITGHVVCGYFYAPEKPILLRPWFRFTLGHDCPIT